VDCLLDTSELEVIDPTKFVETTIAPLLQKEILIAKSGDQSLCLRTSNLVELDESDA
jgi:hypothetical protein